MIPYVNHDDFGFIIRNCACYFKGKFDWIRYDVQAVPQKLCCTICRQKRNLKLFGSTKLDLIFDAVFHTIKIFNFDGRSNFIQVIYEGILLLMALKGKSLANVYLQWIKQCNWQYFTFLFCKFFFLPKQLLPKYII